MRVKLIGVSDEARKSNPLPERTMVIAREKASTFIAGEIDKNRLKEFDGFFGENKLANLLSLARTKK